MKITVEKRRGKKLEDDCHEAVVVCRGSCGVHVHLCHGLIDKGSAVLKEKCKICKAHIDND